MSRFTDTSLIEEDHKEKSLLKTPPLVPDNDSYCSMFFTNFSIQNHGEPKDDVMKAILNGTLPHISPETKNKKCSPRMSPTYTPPPSMLPHPTKLLANPDSHSSQKVHHLSYDYISSDSSFENVSHQLMQSSHSTPTRNGPGRQSRSRIAANFTVPLH